MGSELSLEEKIQTMFKTKLLNLNSSVRELPQIGEYFESRFSNKKIQSIRDLIDYFHDRSINSSIRRLESLSRNKRAGQETAPGSGVKIQEVNVQTFNVIVYVLQYANTHLDLKKELMVPDPLPVPIKRRKPNPKPIDSTVRKKAKPTSSSPSPTAAPLPRKAETEKKEKPGKRREQKKTRNRDDDNNDNMLFDFAMNF